MPLARPRCLTIRPCQEGWSWSLEERAADGAAGPQDLAFVTGFSPTFEGAEQVGWEMFLLWQHQAAREAAPETWPDTSDRAILSGD